MPEKKLSLTAQQPKEIIESAVRAASAPNVLEQKRLDEETQREKRRSALQIELGHVEEESRWRRQHSCTHSCTEKTGESVPMGQGRWTTSGQMSGDDAATLICLRCSMVWRFMPNHGERDYINNAGLLGYPLLRWSAA